MRSTFLAKALTACLLLAVVVAPAVAQDEPQNDGTNDGADVSNDETAANQDQEDMIANADAVGEEVLALAAVPGAPAEPVIAEANELGGKGGVDPATGETLLPLPEVSEFCKGTGQTPSDGTQNVGGSCSSVSQGQVPSQDKMVSTIIVEPENLAKIPLGSDFQVSVVTVNLKTGFFDVAATEYYTQPQTLDDQGVVKGHQHITVQRIADKTRPPNANEKQFFKGLNDAADGTGRLSVTVNATGITEPGLYRICSMTGTFAHQPVLMPVAQRGAQDDCIRIEIVDEGAGNGGNDENGDGGNAENNDAGNNDAGNNDAGNNDAGNNDAGNNDAGNNNGGNNNAAANGNADNGGGNNGAPARAAATAGNAGNNNNGAPARAAATAGNAGNNNNNNGTPARAAATAGNAGNNNNNGTPPRAAATAGGGNRNNNGTPPRAAATAGGNTGRGPRRAAVTAGNGRTNNRAPVRAAATAAWPPSRAAATAAWPPSRAAATAGGAPARAAATAGGANGAANNGGGAGGQGGRSAKEIIAEMLADLNTLEAEV